MLCLEIIKDKNHDPMLVIFLLTSPHPASQLHLRHSANGVPHAQLFIIFSHIALFCVATLSSTFRQWSAPAHTWSLNSLPHIPHRNVVFNMLSMEYPPAWSSNILPHIASSRVATLSLTFRQWSTPVRDHQTFSLTSPHPVLQLCLRHYANGVPPCYFISFTNFLFSLTTFHFLTPHPHHLFLPM